MSEHISAPPPHTLTHTHTHSNLSVSFEKDKNVSDPDMFCSFKNVSLQQSLFSPLCLSSALDFDTSILPICKDSLGWMFNKLDMNFDLLLDQSELSAIYLDKYELCMKPLFNSCDSFKDGKLSNNEWCYCFQKPEGEDGGMVIIRNQLLETEIRGTRTRTSS